MKKLFAISMALFALALAHAAHAQKWPEKPIRIIVPYAPGGNTDVAARLLAKGLHEGLGQPVIVENKTGGGGMIAGEFVAKSAPDGYTLFVSSNGPVLHSPMLYNRNIYQWDRDFAAVGSVSFTPMVLLANPSVPAKGMAELIELAKQRPGQLAMATPGAGSTNHLASELLQMKTGTSWLSVHYKGTALSMNDLVAGHVQLSLDQLSVSVPHVQKGSVRALAVTTPKRSPLLPDVPTFEEAGIKDFTFSTFVGVFAPAKTPAAVIARLNEAMATVLKDPQVVEKFNAMGAEARSSTPAAFFNYLKNEDAKWTGVIVKANVKVE